MIFTGARVDAATAEGWGLVNESVPPGELHARARALAGEIAAKAPLSVQAAKQAVEAGGGVAVEALAGALCASSADAVEGIAALKAKRPPEFEGK